MCGVGVPCTPPAGLGGCQPRRTPWVPGTKRLWQPCGVGAAMSREFGTASAGSSPARAWHHGCHGAGSPCCDMGTPVVPDRLRHCDAAGRGASTQLVPTGHRRCQSGPGATAAAAPSHGSWAGAGSDLPHSQGCWDPGKRLEMVNRLPLYGSTGLALLRPRLAGCPTRHPRPARPLLSRRAVPCRGPGKAPWAMPCSLSPAQECAAGPAIPRWGENPTSLMLAPVAWHSPGPCLSFPMLGSFGVPQCRSQPGILACAASSTWGLHPARHPGGAVPVPTTGLGVPPEAPSLGGSGGAACPNRRENQG